MKNIIIVGNGSSLLDKENGSKIDSFDIVVRFNGFKINGFEKHTGTKTNIWYTVNMHHVRKINEFDRIIVHTWHWGLDDKIYQTLKASTNRPCTKTTREMVREIPLQSPPSTELIAIHHLLKEHNKLTIT